MPVEHLPVLVVLIPLAAGLWRVVRATPDSRNLLVVCVAAVISLLAPMLRHLVENGPIRTHLGGWGVPLGIDFLVDGTGLVMLSMTAVLTAGIAWYAHGYFHRPEVARSFWPLLLLVWGALNNLFVTSDIFNMYVTLELLGLLSVALIALAGTPTAFSAALRYLLAALAGSMFYLLGVAMVYSNCGLLDWGLLRDRIVTGPSAAVALGLVTAGLMLKAAIFPLHFWLPRAHANAPAPVSALLSSLMVKASFYIALRMWLWVFPGALATGTATVVLGVLGAGAIGYGSLLAWRQERLKLLIAYSTVAQLGYLFVFFAVSGVPSGIRPAVQAVVFFAVSHALAKAALFMAAGAMIASYGHDRLAELAGCARRLPLATFAFGAGAVSLIGLPPSGGFVGKYLLIEVTVAQGQWYWAAVLAIGGLLSAAYLFRFLGIAMSVGPASRADPDDTPVVVALSRPAWWLGMAAGLLGLVAYQPLAVIAIGVPGTGGAP